MTNLFGMSSPYNQWSYPKVSCPHHSSQLITMMSSPRKKSSSLIFTPCMRMHWDIASMYRSCSLCIFVGSIDMTSRGTRDVPNWYSHLAITWAFGISSPPATWAVVRFNSFKNLIKSCYFVVCSTMRGSIVWFFWAPICGTSDDDVLDCLCFFS